jgi:hypothetical protein
MPSPLFVHPRGELAHSRSSTSLLVHRLHMPSCPSATGALSIGTLRRVAAYKLSSVQKKTMLCSPTISAHQAYALCITCSTWLTITRGLPRLYEIYQIRIRICAISVLLTMSCESRFSSSLPFNRPTNFSLSPVQRGSK